jgi:hypothetical protein
MPLLYWFIERLSERPIVLVVFGLVAGYVTSQMWRVSKEISSCKDWIGKGGLSQSGQIAAQLHFFLEESERWKKQGLILSITDYSDRIESMIEGLTDRLHNGVSLFLLVGIAGTFYGMATFAFNAPDLSQGAADPQDVLEALRVALGHSFPVGFVGLCLTIGAHPLVSYFDAQLREIVKNAVNQALRLRGAALRQDNSEAVIAELRKLPELFAESVATSNRALIDHFQPLLEIPKAIHDAHDGAIAPLREMFADSRKEWKETISKLDKQNTRITGAIERLERPVLDLSTRINEISQLVMAVQEVVQRLTADAEQVSTALGNVQIGLGSSLETLRITSLEFQNLPANIRSELRVVGEHAVDAMRNYYESIGREYVASVQGIAGGMISDIAEACKRAAGSIEGASDGLRVTAASITPELQTAIQTGADHLNRHLIAFDNAFAKHFPQAVADLEETLRTAAQQIGHSRSVLEGMSAATTVAGEHAKAWADVQGQLKALADTLRSDFEVVDRHAMAVTKSAEAHLRIPASLEKSTAAFDSATRTLCEAVQKSGPNGKQSSWWDRFTSGGKDKTHGS